MKAWIIVTDDFKTYYAKEVEGERHLWVLLVNDMVGYLAIHKGKLVPRMSSIIGGENAEFWLTKEACESAIRGVMG